MIILNCPECESKKINAWDCMFTCEECGAAFSFEDAGWKEE